MSGQFQNVSHCKQKTYLGHADAAIAATAASLRSPPARDTHGAPRDLHGGSTTRYDLRVIAHDILQPMHLLLILLAALVVLGPKRLPSASRAVGRSIREFRSATSLDAPAKTAKTAADLSEPAERDA